jgi:hypothetical protein
VNEAERRAAVRHRFEARCGYCSVHETEAGTELELDHFHPRSAGGSDDLDNLVYCCPACNRLKGDFWPAGDPLTSNQRLLHPGQDNLKQHLREEADCRLIALTATGAFHLGRLRLNRPPLLALRRSRQEVDLLRQNLEAAQADQTQLRDRVAALERDIQDILARLARLIEP